MVYFAIFYSLAGGDGLRKALEEWHQLWNEVIISVRDMVTTRRS